MTARMNIPLAQTTKSVGDVRNHNTNVKADMTIIRVAEKYPAMKISERLFLQSACNGPLKR